MIFYLLRGEVLPLVEFVQEEVLDALRAAAAHGPGPQVAAQGGELAAQRDHLQLEHQPAKEGRERAGGEGGWMPKKRCSTAATQQLPSARMDGRQEL